MINQMTAEQARQRAAGGSEQPGAVALFFENKEALNEAGMIVHPRRFRSRFCGFRVQAAPGIQKDFGVWMNGPVVHDRL